MIYEKSTGRLRLEIFWLSIPDLYVGLKHYITLFIRFIVLLLIIPKLICRVKTIPIKMPALCVHICFICKCRGHTLLDVLKKSKKTGFINCVYRNEMLGMIDFEFKVEFLFCWDKKKHLRGDNNFCFYFQPIIFNGLVIRVTRGSFSNYKSLCLLWKIVSVT